jgi:hypothetical protein
MISSTKIKILIVDDNENLCNSFINRHDGQEFEIHADYSLDKAKERLIKDFFEYDFVVLDGLGHLTVGRTKGQGDQGFAIAAIHAIKELSNKYKRALPYCLYTAYSGNDVLNALKEAEPTLQVFKKSDTIDEQLMWEYIRRCHKNSSETTIRQNYSDIFSIFDKGLLNKGIERELIQFLLAESDPNPDGLKQIARQIRPIMEAVYLKIAEIDRKFLPDGLQQGKEQSLNSAIRHMAGKPKWNNDLHKYELQSQDYMPLHLWHLVDVLQKATSSTAMHYTHATISRYTLSTYKEILADLLLWFKEFTLKHSK